MVCTKVVDDPYQILFDVGAADDDFGTSGVTGRPPAKGPLGKGPPPEGPVEQVGEGPRRVGSRPR